MAGCNSARSEGGLPAGPVGIPVLGAALKWKGPETNLEWTKEFGPIYSVRIGPNQLVYLNTIELVEEYMERKGAAFLGRPEGPAAIANGLLFGQGEAWRENRRAFTRAMWRASLTETYEKIIHQEADLVVADLAKQLGEPLEMDIVLLPALSSRLATLLLGRRLDREGDDMQKLVAQMENLEEVDLTSKSTQMYLKVKHFRRPLEAISGRTIPDMFKMSKALEELIQGWIRERRAELAKAGGDPSPSSLLDQLLTAPEYQNASEEKERELIQSVMDLFNGGVISSVSALEFFILYLVHNPNVQLKVKDEIDQFMSSNAQKDGRISWGDRDQLPYTRATLVEVLRLASVTPSSLPHVATEDVFIEDQYEVPKDVFVMASIFSLHRDQRFYKEPEVFRPERHLDKEGNFVMPKSYRPFGIGERLCVGYQLAEVELFLFMTRILSSFQVCAVDPSTPPPFHTLMRVVRRLKPFTVLLKAWGN